MTSPSESRIDAISRRCRHSAAVASNACKDMAAVLRLADDMDSEDDAPHPADVPVDAPPPLDVQTQPSPTALRKVARVPSHAVFEGLSRCIRSGDVALDDADSLDLFTLMENDWNELCSMPSLPALARECFRAVQYADSFVSLEGCVKSSTKTHHHPFGSVQTVKRAIVELKSDRRVLYAMVPRAKQHVCTFDEFSSSVDELERRRKRSPTYKVCVNPLNSRGERRKYASLPSSCVLLVSRQTVPVLAMAFEYASFRRTCFETSLVSSPLSVHELTDLFHALRGRFRKIIAALDHADGMDKVVLPDALENLAFPELDIASDAVNCGHLIAPRSLVLVSPDPCEGVGLPMGVAQSTEAVARHEEDAGTTIKDDPVGEPPEKKRKRDDGADRTVDAVVALPTGDDGAGGRCDGYVHLARRWVEELAASEATPLEIKWIIRYSLMVRDVGIQRDRDKESDGSFFHTAFHALGVDPSECETYEEFASKMKKARRRAREEEPEVHETWARTQAFANMLFLGR